MIEEYHQPLAEKGVELAYTDEVLKWLVKESGAAQFGARDLRRTIRKKWKTPWQNALWKGLCRAKSPLQFKMTPMCWSK